MIDLHNMLRITMLLGLFANSLSMCAAVAAEGRQPDGDGTVTISGELKQWHKVTLTLDGPFAAEQDSRPNPFTDLAMTVTFTHESGAPEYVVPGYFAADGAAANSSASSGNQWRAHLSPDKAGKWNYAVSLAAGPQVILNPLAGKQLSPKFTKSGALTIGPTDKTGRDFRAKGRLEYVGMHYLRFAGTGDYFLKAGPDAPETLLAYADFDDTVAPKPNAPLKTWQPHERDWREGDPTWKDGQGKGLIGALNYLASKGCNTFSFLPYNAGGDGDNVWPFVSRDDKLHYDCSKLDQWQIVFDHATTRGLHLHFKLQENEIDDDRRGHDATDGQVKESLDGGKLGIERTLYCRELIARFSHELGLLWNIGEENTQSAQEQRDMIRYLSETDPYRQNIVIHTFPNQQDKVYGALLGDQSLLTGASLQNSWGAAHQRTLKWVQESALAGRPWVVCNDEQNPASDGVPADPGYKGNDGFAEQGGKKYTMHDDKIPFWDMQNADALIGNIENDNGRFCLAKHGKCYLVYLPHGGSNELDLSGATGEFQVQWFNPRIGGALQAGTVSTVTGGSKVSLGKASLDTQDDWLIVVRR